MTEPTIEINMDKPCKKCGQMGAMENDFCMSCAADKIFDIEKLITETLVCASKQIDQLMALHSAQIHRAYLTAEDAKLSIGITVDLAASDEMPNTIVVRSRINFVESRVRDEKTTRISAQQKLPI